MVATLHRVRQVKPIVKVMGRGINLRVRQPPSDAYARPRKAKPLRTADLIAGPVPLVVDTKLSTQRDDQRRMRGDIRFEFRPRPEVSIVDRMID